MMKFRVSVMLCLALGLLSSYVYGQPAAQYTGQPATNAERKEMIAEADWYVAAFKDPEKAFKDDQANVFKYLGHSPVRRTEGGDPGAYGPADAHGEETPRARAVRPAV